jgi:hypothetical protein
MAGTALSPLPGAAPSVTVAPVDIPTMPGRFDAIPEPVLAQLQAMAQLTTATITLLPPTTATNDTHQGR